MGVVFLLLVLLLPLSVPAEELGELSANPVNPDSTSNPFGAGTPLKPDGLKHPFSPDSNQSATNPYEAHAPTLDDQQGNDRGKLSANLADPDSTRTSDGRTGSPISPDSIDNPLAPGVPTSPAIPRIPRAGASELKDTDPLPGDGQHARAHSERTGGNMNSPIRPPFTLGTTLAKAQAAEDAGNSRDPERVSLAYTEDSEGRNRSEFLRGRESIRDFLARKWAREHDHRLTKEWWAFGESRIAVRFEHAWHDDAGQWYRSDGNEMWEFDERGLMARRSASLNEAPIHETERRLSLPTWTAARPEASG
jgi:nuclear transport factor 2 (NTF2) superfamily protein